MAGVVVRKVENDTDFRSGDMKVFFEFPWTVYKNDPNWVPPLVSGRRNLLDRTKNPTWEYIDGNYYIAWRGDKPVGIIAAFINKRHNEHFNEKLSWFGWFECLDDQEAATALLQTAIDFGKQKGMTAVRGPASFTLNDECSLLIENFSRPVILMPYNPPYYQRLIETAGLGYTKVMDLESWHSDPESLGGKDGTEMPQKLIRVTQKLKEKNRIIIRTPTLETLKADLLALKEIFTTAWARNWGAVPPSDAEVDHLFTDLKDYFDPTLVRFAEIDGEIVAFVLGLPDMNQVLSKAYGRPGVPDILTQLAALWHWKIKPVFTRKPSITGNRILLFGIKPEHRGKGVDAAILLDLFQGLLKHPIYWDNDSGWFLETNQPMLQLAVSMKGTPYKRYRFYETPLIPGGVVVPSVRVLKS
jgi:hypothetical protein